MIPLEVRRSPIGQYIENLDFALAKSWNNEVFFSWNYDFTHSKVIIQVLLVYRSTEYGGVPLFRLMSFKISIRYVAEARCFACKRPCGQLNHWRKSGEGVADWPEATVYSVVSKHPPPKVLGARRKWNLKQFKVFAEMVWK